jgi:hypothetical protein
MSWDFRARLQARDNIRLVILGGIQHEVGVAGIALPPDGTAERQTIHIGKIDVQYDDRRKVLLQRGKRGSGIRCGAYLVTRCKNRLAKMIEDYLVIVDQQYFYSFLRCQTTLPCS